MIKNNFRQSSNPALSDKVFRKVSETHVSDSSTMTIKGTATKFFLMMVLLVASASYTWRLWFLGEAIYGWLMGGVFGGLIVAMIISFNPRRAPLLAPIYALLEGLFIGGISAILQENFQETMPNIIINSVGLTLGIVITMSLLYFFRIIKPTKKFKAIVISSTIGIGLFYFASILLSFFGIDMVLIHSSGTYGILFSLFIVVIASLNIILDLERVEYFSTNNSPKFMEWYCSFGLTITVVWLYIEILRLFSKLASNRG